MSEMASQITSLTIVYSSVYLGPDERKHQKLRVTGSCEGNSPGTDEFPAQRARDAENSSIWWRHHTMAICEVPGQVDCQESIIFMLVYWHRHLKLNWPRAVDPCLYQITASSFIWVKVWCLFYGKPLSPVFPNYGLHLFKELCINTHNCLTSITQSSKIKPFFFSFNQSVRPTWSCTRFNVAVWGNTGNIYHISLGPGNPYVCVGIAMIRSTNNTIWFI